MISKWQVFSPKFISDFMVSLITKKDKNIKILEPWVWYGVFIDSLNEKWYNKIQWIELDTTIYNKIKDKYNDIIEEDFILFSNKNKNKYSLIIWNPPYTQNNEIVENTMNNINSLFLWFDNKEWDLYYYFIQQSIDHLEENWELIFITPITFLTNSFSKTLRDFIYYEWYLTDIFSLEEEKVFNKADVEVIIWKFIKNKKKDKWKIRVGIINKKIHYNKTTSLYVKDFNIKYIDHFSDSDFFWNIYKETTINYKYSIDINSIFNISVWMVSWYEKWFIIDIKTIWLLNDLEKQFIKKIFKAKNCWNNNIKLNNQIFIPKWYFETEKEFKQKCPNLYIYILKNKENLLNRYNKNKSKFWEWITIRNKIIYDNKKDFYCIPTITRKENIWFTQYRWNMYWGGDIVCLTFKDNISQKDKEKFKKIILSDKYAIYMNSIVPKKWNRKLYTQKFLTTLKV